MYLGRRPPASSERMKPETAKRLYGEGRAAFPRAAYPYGASIAARAQRAGADDHNDAEHHKIERRHQHQGIPGMPTGCHSATV
jgi:hypothetical protein